MTGSQRLNGQMPILSRATNDRNWSRRQRKAHHKVKTGCKACKIRRQKCDELKPTCSGCSRHSTACTYPTQELRLLERGNLEHLKLVTNLPLQQLPMKALPLSPSSELNLGDLELLHQFLTSTCMATAQLPRVTAHIQTTVPPLAQAYPFVMRGILAMAATHLSRLRPSRQKQYAMSAARHHKNALPEFRSALQDLNNQNCHALISYAKSILWCSLASDPSLNDTEADQANRGTWLPQWFSLLRGSCQLVESSRPWIKAGPLLLPKPDDTAEFVQGQENTQISMLISQLALLTDSSSCAIVLSSLLESFALASMRHHNTPYRNAINFWAGSLTDDYVLALHKKEPWALVVLAHFCVLFHRSETVWFMKGHATRLLLSVVEHLDDSWRRYIRWPCQELGLDDDYSTNVGNLGVDLHDD